MLVRFALVKSHVTPEVNKVRLVPFAFESFSMFLSCDVDWPVDPCPIDLVWRGRVTHSHGALSNLARARIAFAVILHVPVGRCVVTLGAYPSGFVGSSGSVGGRDADGHVGDLRGRADSHHSGGESDSLSVLATLIWIASVTTRFALAASPGFSPCAYSEGFNQIGALAARLRSLLIAFTSWATVAFCFLVPWVLCNLRFDVFAFAVFASRVRITAERILAVGLSRRKDGRGIRCVPFLDAGDFSGTFGWVTLLVKAAQSFSCTQDTRRLSAFVGSHQTFDSRIFLVEVNGA